MYISTIVVQGRRGPSCFVFLQSFGNWVIISFPIQVRRWWMRLAWRFFCWLICRDFRTVHLSALTLHGWIISLILEEPETLLSNITSSSCVSFTLFSCSAVVGEILSRQLSLRSSQVFHYICTPYTVTHMPLVRSCLHLKSSEIT